MSQQINEAVARKLGWVYNLHPYQYWVPSDLVARDKHGDRPSGVPAYSTSIEAAWEILTDYCDTWEIFCNGSTVDVTLSKNYNTASHEADLCPMAICLAFLKLP